MAKQSFKHYFSKNPTVNSQRTLFDMSYTNTTTINPDYCYPVYHQLILPGDTIVLNYSNMIRMLDPLQVPMMDNLYADMLFFFVPFDQVWDYVPQFFGEKKRPSDPEISTLPQIQFTSSTLPTVGSVYDYFDIPIANLADSGNLLTNGFSIQALPLLSYYAIHDDWIRDEQRVDYLLDSPDFKAQTFTPDKFSLYKRGKRFDYFTSTILEPNMPTTSLPLGVGAQVYGDGSALTFTDDRTSLSATHLANISTATNSSNNMAYFNFPAITSSGAISANLLPSTNSATTHYNTIRGNIGLATKEQVYNNTGVSGYAGTGLYADLSTATAVSVEQLRRAFQVQAYQEMINRYGSRLSEYIYAMYGVITDDLLYRRCEFLGSTHQRLSVQPIVQQSSSTTNAPLGDLGAIVQGGTSQDVFTRSFTQYGYIIGILNIYADLTYYQGLDKEWSLLDKMDMPLNIFANLTDQPVYKKELVLTGTSSDDEVFGYQEIYAWAKYRKNTLSGLVRPNAPQTVGYWSLAQKFDSVPVNDDTFINSDTDISRITSVTGNDNTTQHFIVNQKFDVKLTRELPAHSNPMKWFSRG